MFRLSGVIRKYKVEATRLMATMMSRLRIESLMSDMSLVPRPRPTPKIGPIRGDMSMAPMMTGMELTFSPTEAMTIEKARIHALGPLKNMLLLMDCAAASVST